jgi:hypothetical protein
MLSVSLSSEGSIEGRRRDLSRNKTTRGVDDDKERTRSDAALV